MNLWPLRITGTKKPPYRTKVSIRASWLADMGFVYDAPVWAIPQKESFTLTLSEPAEDSGGKLIHVGREGEKLALTLNFAKNFVIPGLVAGDFLAASYEYGLITARKLPPAQKYYVIGTQNHSAFLQLSGKWLDDAGFLPETVITALPEPGRIRLYLWNNAIAEYTEVVKLARASKRQILQPKRNQSITILDLDAYELNRAGFEPGDLCGVHYEYGRIRLFNPDLQRLDF